MATISQVHASLVSKPRGIVKLPVAAAQTLYIGSLVYLNGGLVTACASDSKSIFGISNQNSASVAVNTSVEVIPLDELSELEMNVYHSTVTSAITANTQVGENYALLVSTKCYCDIEDTTNVVFSVKRLSKRDAVGDTYGRVIVNVISAYLQKNASS